MDLAPEILSQRHGERLEIEEQALTKGHALPSAEEPHGTV